MGFRSLGGKCHGAARREDGMRVSSARIPRESKRSTVLATALVTIVALGVPMAGVAGANHGARTARGRAPPRGPRRWRLPPGRADNPIGTTHTLTATLSSAADATSGTIE